MKEKDHGYQQDTLADGLFRERCQGVASRHRVGKKIRGGMSFLGGYSYNFNECPLYIRHIAVGEPAREILKIIADQKINIIVMANRGSEGHFNFGSVAERILKSTTVPVVMIPVI